jgi:hypothetical protein
MQEIVNSFKIGMNEVTLTAERANGMKVKNFVRGVRGGKWCACTRSYISASDRRRRSDRTYRSEHSAQGLSATQCAHTG